MSAPTCVSFARLAPHSEELPIPVFEGLPQLESALSSEDGLSSTDSETTIADNDFPPSLLPPQLFSQNELIFLSAISMHQLSRDHASNL